VTTSRITPVVKTTMRRAITCSTASFPSTKARPRSKFTHTTRVPLILSRSSVRSCHSNGESDWNADSSIFSRAVRHPRHPLADPLAGVRSSLDARPSSCLWFLVSALDFGFITPCCYLVLDRIPYAYCRRAWPFPPMCSPSRSCQAWLVEFIFPPLPRQCCLSAICVVLLIHVCLCSE
jgi:hypothetical protein